MKPSVFFHWSGWPIDVPTVRELIVFVEHGLPLHLGYGPQLDVPRCVRNTRYRTNEHRKLKPLRKFECIASHVLGFLLVGWLQARDLPVESRKPRVLLV